MIGSPHSGAEALWLSVWKETFYLPEATPEWAVVILAIFFIFFCVILPVGGVVSLVERKLGADLQARVGPNRAGWGGVLQPLADLLKLLQKESQIRQTWQEWAWSTVYTMALFSTVAVLPLGTFTLLVDTDMSAFIPFWSALVLTLGSMLMGLNQQTLPGWLGGVRLATQAIAGVFPALITVLCVAVRAGGFRWSGFAGAQGFWPQEWASFSNPFQFLAAIIFVISGLVMMSLSPMDSPYSKMELQGGVVSSLDGKRLSLFRLCRFYGFFLWSTLSVVLFFGAWNLPVGVLEYLSEQRNFHLIQGLECMVLLLKTLTLMSLVIWVARVNPRNRVDQITDLAWKILSPFALVALIGASLWAGWSAL